MKMQDKLKVLDWFFSDFKEYQTIHLNELSEWFYSKSELSMFDRNQFYDFRRTLLSFMDSGFNNCVSFDFDEIIEFYTTTFKDKEKAKIFQEKKKEKERVKK